MTHPEDLLADYVDGTLPHAERAVVDAHLATCDRCREEVALARGAVRALASLEDRPVPFGVIGPVLAEAGKSLERRGAVWQRVQWAAGIAAAIALVVAIGLNIGGSGVKEHPEALNAASGGSAAATVAPGDVRLERQRDVNYDGIAGVRALADEEAASYAAKRSASDSAAPAAESDDSAAPAAPQAGGSGDTLLSPAETANPAAALRCLQGSQIPLDQETSTLVRLVEAKFSGTPAYFAVILQGPGADQPPDRIVVLVVARDGCTLLNGTSEKLPT